MKNKNFIELLNLKNEPRTEEQIVNSLDRILGVQAKGKKGEDDDMFKNIKKMNDDNPNPLLNFKKK